MTLLERVFAQVLAEGPDNLGHKDTYDKYVVDTINRMTNVELLMFISSALVKQELQLDHHDSQEN